MAKKGTQRGKIKLCQMSSRGIEQTRSGETMKHSRKQSRSTREKEKNREESVQTLEIRGAKSQMSTDRDHIKHQNTRGTYQ